MTRTRHAVWSLALLLLVSTAPAQDEPRPTANPMSKVTELTNAFDAAQKAAMDAYNSAPKETRWEAYQKLVPDREAYGKKFQAVADAHPGTEAAGRALAWVVANTRGEGVARALEVIAESHVKTPGLASFCLSLRYNREKVAEDVLARIIAENGEAQTVAAAKFTVAARTLRMSAYEDVSKERMALAQTYLEEVARDHSEAEVGRFKLGEMASASLFELKNLRIGAVAPNIKGKDADGVDFMLTDYRGKVVVLDFWGHW